MLYQAIENAEGHWDCICETKDSLERWTRNTKDEAYASIMEAAYQFNHEDITDEDVEFVYKGFVVRGRCPNCNAELAFGPFSAGYDFHGPAGQPGPDVSE